MSVDKLNEEKAFVYCDIHFPLFIRTNKIKNLHTHTYARREHLCSSCTSLIDFWFIFRGERGCPTGPTGNVCLRLIYSYAHCGSQLEHRWNRECHVAKFLGKGQTVVTWSAPPVYYCFVSSHNLIVDRFKLINVCMLLSIED